MKRAYIICYAIIVFIIIGLLLLGMKCGVVVREDIFKELIFASVAGGLFSVVSVGIPHYIAKSVNKRHFRKDIRLYQQALKGLQIGEVGNWLERTIIKIRDSFSYNEIGYLEQKELDLLADLEICRQKIPPDEFSTPYAVKDFRETIESIFTKYLREKKK